MLCRDVSGTVQAHPLLTHTALVVPRARPSPGPVLASLPALESLDLSWNGELRGGIGHLADCAKLKRLSLSGTVVSADPAAIRKLLHALPDEEGTRFVLMAVKPCIGAAVAQAIKTHLWNSFTPLSEWDRAGGRIKTDAAGANVVELNLSHTQLSIDLEDLGFLLSNLLKLAALDLSGNGASLTGDLIHLMTCRKLKRLTLTGCPAILANAEGLKGCRNRPLLHLLVQEWLRSNSHVTSEEHNAAALATLKDADDEDEKKESGGPKDAVVASPTRASVYGRGKQVEPMRALLKSLLLELLPIVTSNSVGGGGASNSSGRKGSDGGSTDGDLNAAKRVLLELKPYIKTKKFTDSWTLDRPIEDFVFILDEPPASSATTSASVVALPQAADGGHSGRTVRGVVMHREGDGDDEDDEFHHHHHHYDHHHHGNGGARHLLGTSSVPALGASASSSVSMSNSHSSSRLSGIMGSTGAMGQQPPPRVTGLNLQGYVQFLTLRSISSSLVQRCRLLN